MEVNQEDLEVDKMIEEEVIAMGEEAMEEIDQLEVHLEATAQNLVVVMVDIIKTMRENLTKVERAMEVGVVEPLDGIKKINQDNSMLLLMMIIIKNQNIIPSLLDLLKVAALLTHRILPNLKLQIIVRKVMKVEKSYTMTLIMLNPPLNYLDQMIFSKNKTPSISRI